MTSEGASTAKPASNPQQDEAGGGQDTATAGLDAPEFVTGNYPLMIIGVMAASLLQILDTTIANVALPHMQSSLGATVDTVTWVLTSYIIASAVALADHRLARRQDRCAAAVHRFGCRVHPRLNVVRPCSEP